MYAVYMLKLENSNALNVVVIPSDLMSFYELYIFYLQIRPFVSFSIHIFTIWMNWNIFFALGKVSSYFGDWSITDILKVHNKGKYQTL